MINASGLLVYGALPYSRAPRLVKLDGIRLTERKLSFLSLSRVCVFSSLDRAPAVVLQWSYSGSQWVTVVCSQWSYSGLQWSYSGPTVVHSGLQWFYSGSPWSYSGPTVVLQWFTAVLHWFYSGLQWPYSGFTVVGS